MSSRPDSLEVAIIASGLLFMAAVLVAVIIHNTWFDEGADVDNCPAVEVDGREYWCVP